MLSTSITCIVNDVEKSVVDPSCAGVSQVICTAVGVLMSTVGFKAYAGKVSCVKSQEELSKSPTLVW